MSIASVEITGHTEAVALLPTTGGDLIPHPIFSGYVSDIGDADKIAARTKEYEDRFLSPFIAAAHRVGALVHLDAVHFAPHGLIDVQLLDCDFLACSAYKFCGPHIGILYGRQALLESLTAYKVRPASSVPPGKWETGTQNTEALAGLGACLDYISNLGGPTDTFNHSVRSRSTLTSGMQWVVAHEQKLSHHFLNGAAAIPGLKVHGIADPGRTSERTPTFGLTLAGIHPRDACERLAERGIWSWDGHFYAQGVIAQLGLAEHGGLLRIGFAHYTTIDEVETVLESLRQL